MKNQYKPVSPSSFIKAIKEAKATLPSKKAPFVSIPQPQSLQFCFLSEDKLSGYAISAHGEIIGVFSLAKGRLSDLVSHALHSVQVRGYLGAHLHCFSPLVPIFGRYGLELNNTYPWDDNLSPADWNKKELGTPSYNRLVKKFLSFQ